MKSSSLVAKLVLLFGILLAACSSDDDRRSEVLLNIQSGVPAMDTVNVTAWAAGASVKTASVPWTKANAGALQIGLYIPAGVAGPVDITAQGFLGTAVVAEGKVDKQVALKSGAVVGPYELILSAKVEAPDGGVDAEVTDGPVPEVSSVHEVSSVLEVSSVHEVSSGGDGLADVLPADICRAAAGTRVEKGRVLADSHARLNRRDPQGNFQLNRSC